MSEKYFNRIVLSLFTFGWCLFTLGVTGCGRIAKDMADSLADTTIEKRVSIPIGSGDDIATCFASPGGGCPHKDEELRALESAKLSTEMPEKILDALSKPGKHKATVTDLGAVHTDERNLANFARNVLEGTTFLKIVDVYNAMILASITIASKNESSDESKLELSWNELEELFDGINYATEIGAWEMLDLQVKTSLMIKNELKQDVDVMAYVRLADYINQYIKAYFRNGQFIKATIDLDKIMNNLKQELKARFGITDDEVLQKMAEKYLSKFGWGTDENGSKFTFGNIGETGFVTRGGAKYQFPAIEAKVDPTAERPLTVTKIDPIIIGNDLLRVILEATFDSKQQLPCVSDSTAATEIKDAIVNDPDLATERKSVHLSGEDFQSVESWANMTEAASSTLVGRLIRGGGWVALNNEALAQFVETLVGVIVRKLTEKAAWCAYSCSTTEAGLDGLNKSAKIFASTRHEKLKVRLLGKPPIFNHNPWK